MIGMEVSTGGVVGYDHGGTSFLEDVEDLLCDGNILALEETAGMLVVRGAGHARVAVAQLVEACDAQNARSTAKLPGAELRQADVIAYQLRRLLAKRAVGQGKNVDGIALSGIACQGASGPERLVVRMSKDGEQSSGDRGFRRGEGGHRDGGAPTPRSAGSRRGASNRAMAIPSEPFWRRISKLW